MAVDIFHHSGVTLTCPWEQLNQLDEPSMQAEAAQEEAADELKRRLDDEREKLTEEEEVRAHAKITWLAEEHIVKVLYATLVVFSG